MARRDIAGTPPEYRRSIASRSIADQKVSRRIAARALSNTASVYEAQGNSRLATETYLPALEAARALQDRNLEFSILGNLALSFVSLEQYADALGYLHLQLGSTRTDAERARINNAIAGITQRIGGSSGNAGAAANAAPAPAAAEPPALGRQGSTGELVKKDGQWCKHIEF